MTHLAATDDLFYARAGLDRNRLETMVNDALTGADDGELFLERRHAEVLVFDDGRLRNASYDAAEGKEKEREKFKMNEGGLALTEADPVFDDRFLYISGRGRVRAVDRRTGNVVWKADDLGNVSEMVISEGTLFVRTGGRFTRLKDGEIRSKGPFGVSAINTENGDTRWRFKGADKGLTNFVFPDRGSILIADSDHIYHLDASTGERRARFDHDVDDARFVILNEGRQAVVGGGDEIAASTLLSTLDPRRTLLEQADPGWLDPELARAVGQIRRRPPGRRFSS